MKERDAHIFERDPLDWYLEPISSTSLLLTEEKFIGPIWDPACGQGHILMALIDAGYFEDLVGSDITDRRIIGHDKPGEFPLAAQFNVFDFLANTDRAIWLDRYEPVNIVMNPPYFGGKGTEAFIRRALAIASGKVAVFVDRRFLTGATRARGLYSKFPPTRVWEITPRPSCPPGEYLRAGNKAGGGTADYCWLVWDKTAPAGPTILGWLKGKGKRDGRLEKAA